MNAIMTKQKIIEVSGNNKNCTYPATFYAVNMKSMNRLTS